MNDTVAAPPSTAPAPGSKPDAGAVEARHQMAETRLDGGKLALTVLAVLAVFYTLYFAASIILPLLLAGVVTLLLAPGKRLLVEKLRLPAGLAALLLILAMFVVVTAIGLAISLPASTWIGKAPQSLPELQHKLGFIAPAVEFARHGLDQLQHIMQPGGGAAGGGAGGAAAGGGQQTVAVQQQTSLGGVGMVVLEGTRAALGQVLTMLVVLFFTLAWGDSLLRSVVEIMPTFGDKRRVVEIAVEIERNISGYLVTITAMNLLVGIGNGLAMWALGRPDPLLWGTLAFLLNYIPILGPFIGIVIFFFVGLFTTQGLWPALISPAIYLAIHVVEGETVTPMLLARRFTLNPVLVIVSLFFWDWLWGVTGALLAVPLLAIAKIVCDRIPALTPLGHLIGGSKGGVGA